MEISILGSEALERRALFSYASQEYDRFIGINPPHEKFLAARFNMNSDKQKEVIREFCVEGYITGRNQALFQVNKDLIRQNYGFSSTTGLRSTVGNNLPDMIENDFLPNALNIAQNVPQLNSPVRTAVPKLSLNHDLTSPDINSPSDQQTQDDSDVPDDHHGNIDFIRRRDAIVSQTDEIKPLIYKTDTAGRSSIRYLDFPERYRIPDSNKIIGANSVDLIGVNQKVALYGILHDIIKPTPFGDEGKYLLKMALRWEHEVIDVVLFADNKTEADAFAKPLKEGKYYLTKGFRIKKPKYQKPYITNDEVGLVIDAKTIMVELQVRARYVDNPRIKKIDKEFCGRLGQPETTKTKIKPKAPKKDMSHFGKLRSLETNQLTLDNVVKKSPLGHVPIPPNPQLKRRSLPSASITTTNRTQRACTTVPSAVRTPPPSTSTSTMKLRSRSRTVSPIKPKSSSSKSTSGFKRSSRKGSKRSRSPSKRPKSRKSRKKRSRRYSSTESESDSESRNDTTTSPSRSRSPRHSRSSTKYKKQRYSSSKKSSRSKCQINSNRRTRSQTKSESRESDSNSRSQSESNSKPRHGTRSSTKRRSGSKRIVQSKSDRRTRSQTSSDSRVSKSKSRSPTRSNSKPRRRTRSQTLADTHSRSRSSSPREDPKETTVLPRANSPDLEDPENEELELRLDSEKET